MVLVPHVFIVAPLHIKNALEFNVYKLQTFFKLWVLESIEIFDQISHIYICRCLFIELMFVFTQITNFIQKVYSNRCFIQIKCYFYMSLKSMPHINTMDCQIFPLFHFKACNYITLIGSTDVFSPRMFICILTTEI